MSENEGMKEYQLEKGAGTMTIREYIDSRDEMIRAMKIRQPSPLRFVRESLQRQISLSPSAMKPSVRLFKMPTQVMWYCCLEKAMRSSCIMKTAVYLGKVIIFPPRNAFKRFLQKNQRTNRKCFKKSKNFLDKYSLICYNASVLLRKGG